MGIRMDQFAGLSQSAKQFLAECEVKPHICETCKQPIHEPLKQIGKYKGMYMNEYFLYQHILENGQTADEFVQCAPWSSGPIFFLGLRVSDGTEFVWSVDEMESWF